jgi:hypothetical protein
MKVSELKKLLERFDDDDLLILARDAEGNGYSPLGSVWNGIYVAEAESRGNAYLSELSQEDQEAGFTEEDVYSEPDGIHAVFLVPM